MMNNLYKYIIWNNYQSKENFNDSHFNINKSNKQCILFNLLRNFCDALTSANILYNIFGVKDFGVVGILGSIIAYKQNIHF